MIVSGQQANGAIRPSGNAPRTHSVAVISGTIRSVPDDLYEILGVKPASSTSAIRTAFRRLAVTLHPDRAGHASTAAFQRVVAAYEILSDPVQRERYDARIAQQRSASTVHSPSAGPRQLIARLSGPLRSLLAAGLLRTVGEDAYEVWLTADEAAHGGYVTISTSAPKQLAHWLSIPAGVVDGTVVSSRARVESEVFEMRLQLRVL